jgi:DNA-binding CsgD family transcriptional regulator
LSDITRVLTARSSELEFEPMGDRTLKGFTQSVALYKVRRPAEASIRPGLTRFTGRVEETALLRSHLDEAVRGRGGLVLVAGEPGVGKTRLVSELAVYAADRGLEVLSGRAYETEGMPPYLPLTEPLGRYIQGRSPEELRTELDGNGPYLAKLLPELRRLLPDLEEPPSLSPEGERYRLFESVCDFLLKIAQARPVLLHLDDLHWADEASQLLLQHLAPRLAEGPLLVVASYRNTEAEPLASLLAELRRQRLGTTVALKPFGCEEASALLEAILGEAAAPQAVEALFAASEGNPFFMEELVWNLREQGTDLTNPEHIVEGRQIPEGVKQVIAGRLARLSGEANRLLAYSSVLGRDVSLKKVASVTDRDDIDVLDLLEEAVASHVLREAPEGYAFAHPLIRETLYRGLTGTRRRLLHRRTAEALEALYGADVEPHQLVELAHHFFQAAAKGEDVDKAIAYATRAAERALELVAWEEAARLYQMALQALALEREPNLEERCELLLALGEAQNAAGDASRGRETFEAAAGLARQLRSPQILARAALGRGGLAWTSFVASDEYEVGLLEEALAMVDPVNSRLYAILSSRLAIELCWSSVERSAPLTEQALHAARRQEDPAILSYALIARHLGAWTPDNVDERLDVATEAIRLAERAGNFRELAFRDCGFEARYWRTMDLIELGDLKAARVAMGELEARARELPIATSLWFTKCAEAGMSIFQGRFDEGETLAREAFAIGQRATIQQAAVMVFTVQMLALPKNQEAFANVQTAAGGTVWSDSPTSLAWRSAGALRYASDGQYVEARREFERLAAHDFADIPRDYLWLVSIGNLSEVCAYLGDTRRASKLYEVLLPHAHKNVVIACFLFTGSVARRLGLLATSMHRWEEAQRHFEDSLERNRRTGARPDVVWTQHDYAKMLLARRGPGDRKKAYALLKEALEAAQEMGMKSLEERAQKLLESRKGLVPKYPDGLSRREVDVLRLIAAGSSNDQIAEQLFLSPRTVERHISNIYGKISARSRVEAAAYASSHGLAVPAKR